MNSSDEKSEWRETLIKIFEELTSEEYKKMVALLPEIPGGKRQTSKLKLVDIIIKLFGLKESIAKISTVMEKIPRKDPTIQGYLSPFNQNLEKSNKQNPRNESFEDESPAANGRKRKYERKLDGEESGTATKQENLDQYRTIIPIANLKSNKEFVNKGIQVKVIRISQMLKSYKTKKEKKNEFFYMGVADDTGFVKIIVFGKEKYKKFEEGSCYMLHKFIIEEDTVKVTSNTLITEPKPFEVPLEFETQAAMLIESPVYSIDEAIGSKQQTLSIEGFVKEIDDRKVIVDKSKVNQRILTVQEKEDSVKVVLWREKGQLCKALVGDKVRVTNLCTNEYKKIISLNSTTMTNVIKIQDAPIKTLNMFIISVKGYTKANVTLGAELDGDMMSFIVSEKLLAQTYDIKLGVDFKKDFLAKLPMVVTAKVKGNEIKSFIHK